MLQKVSDYIADFLVSAGVSELFTVPGGLAMHMNDSFGHKEGLNCTYNHHEQACGMAAEAYARYTGKMAAVCVTAGPAAANMVSGALGPFMSSLPLIVFSGECRIPTSVRASGAGLRCRGTQECDIISVVRPITKYAAFVENKEDIRYHLERAVRLAGSGRPGPVWIDVPLDVQGASVETEALRGYDPSEDADADAPAVSGEAVEAIIRKIKEAKRPVIIPGMGIRIAGAYEKFMEFAEKAGVPVATTVSTVDFMPESHPLYIGRTGPTGERAANISVQSADLIISIGGRLSYSVTGFDEKTWARAAFLIMSDADAAEMDKTGIRPDMKVQADAAELLTELGRALDGRGCTAASPLFAGNGWTERCRALRKKYPAVTAEHFKTLEEGRSNIYAFYDALSDALPEGAALSVSVGTSRVVGAQAFRAKKGQRMVTNSNTAAMGFDLPAIMGLHRAAPDKEIIGVTGEGSLMMNLQELQTLRHAKVPFKLFVVDNEGYQSVRQTQSGFFATSLVGVGPESGDISFPDLSKLVPAFGFAYAECGDTKKLAETIETVLQSSEPTICRILVSKQQTTQPKSSSRRLADGSMVSAPLEDMAPFLPREELAEAMSVPLTEASLRQ